MQGNEKSTKRTLLMERRQILLSYAHFDSDLKKHLGTCRRKFNVINDKY